MKKERYFRHELQNMFISYGIIPAVIFMLICGIVLMAALLYGRGTINRNQNRYVAQELHRVLTGYEQLIQNFIKNPKLLADAANIESGVAIHEAFFAEREELGYDAELFLLDEKRSPVFSDDDSLLQLILEDTEGEWGIFGTMNRQPEVCAVGLLRPWDAQGRMLVMGYAITDRGKVKGYAVLAFPESYFQDILNHSEAQTIVTDAFGWAFLSSSQQLLTTSGQILPGLVSEKGYYPVNGHASLVASQAAYGGRLMVYTVSDIQNIITSLGFGSALALTVLTLMAIWMLINAKRVTEKKTEDFYRILEVMEEAAGGNLEQTIQIERENEFATIADTYNQMIASLKAQMENNQKMSQLVASSQNKQLESQFNPHFLYNTLENIRYMCKMQPELAEKMICSLSGLLRYSLDSTETQVTLNEDLRYLEHYLTILQYRFNRRFSYELDVDPEALDCRIPKLVLQPMIENSVKYGFGAQESLRVELKIYLYEGKLVMICRDDGVGMSTSVLHELWELLKKEENYSRHSGLYNIHRRILLLYGSPYGVDIRSTEGHGTTLVVTLPIQKGDAGC